MNTKQGVWLLGVLGLIIVILIGFLIFAPSKKHEPNPITGTEGLAIFSLRPDQEISSPLKITGQVRGDGWTGFEGQVGTVRLLDKDGNQLGQTAVLTATTDWIKPPVNFEANLTFISSKAQIGRLVFRNENPSGLPEKDKEFVLLVKIK